ncbi:MAG TPA: hypothetical protein VK625_18190 [Flavitalea sp.]|nr:hypothetical protein [Flavitalea sp.]
MKKSFFLKTALALIMIAGMTGCITARKVDKWVGRHYAQTVPTKFKTADYITFKIENSLPADRVSETKKTNGQVIPALLYWKWKHETTSVLNVMLPAGNFTNSFIAQANAKKIKEILNGGSLVVTIKSNPADFRFHEDGWLVFVLVYYIAKEKIYVEPVNSDLSFDYTLTKPTGETKTGSINIANPNIEKQPRLFQSLKGAVKEYLDASDSHIKNMSKELVDKLIVEIKSGT